MQKLSADAIGRAVLLAGCVMLSLHAPAQAQRVIFPTPVESGPVYVSQLPQATPTAPPYGAPAYGAPAYSAPSYTAPGAAPSLAPPTTPFAQPYPYGAPNSAAPFSYTPPSYPPGSYPGAANPYAPPTATLPGTIQPPPQPWDPYGQGATPTLGNPVPGQPGDGFVIKAYRLLQEARLQETYIAPGSGNSSLGMNDIEMFASFGFPLLKKQPPIIVTPGFGFHLWDGPVSIPGINNDLPGAVYDAYLATSWRPQITPRVSADLAVSVGDYSDFTYTDSTSIRVLGRGLGLVTLSPQWTLVAGVVYVNRLQVKLLPAGGLIFTPHPDSRYELLFPNPKISQRLTTLGNTDVWGYIAGEYGGGQWSITHADHSHDVVNYNDLRLLLGLDLFRLDRIRGNVEVGYVFNRTILYAVGAPDQSPPNTILFRGGISY